MSSVFDRFRSNKPINMFQDIKRIQNNPAELTQLLLNSGRISQEQYQHIKGMNSPKDMCIYLMGQNEQFRNAVQMIRTLQS